MSLTDAQIVKVFKVFGVPKGGSAYLSYEQIKGVGITGADYDVSALAAALTTQLTALDTDQEAEVAANLTKWPEVGDEGEMNINASFGTTGTVINFEKRRQMIRDELTNIIGFAAPTGGFALEANRQASDCMAGRLIR